MIGPGAPSGSPSLSCWAAQFTAVCMSAPLSTEKLEIPAEVIAVASDPLATGRMA